VKRFGQHHQHVGGLPIAVKNATLVGMWNGCSLSAGGDSANLLVPLADIEPVLKQGLNGSARQIAKQ
jgi:hypothetical protein